jgi:transcriptional antiterminator NusG
MNWYTLRVISGKEKKIRENILFEISTANLDQYVENILVPTENVLEMRDGKKKIKEKVFFPGYLLLHLDMNKETKYVVENVNGVMSFIGSKGKPEALKPSEVTRFLGDHDGLDGPIKIHKGPIFYINCIPYFKGSCFRNFNWAI